MNSQRDLLNKWCPNVADVSIEDLPYVCWACGAFSHEHYHSRLGLMTRCHIDRYQPDEVECPDNFILLCNECHREQPDALPKEAIKYWLFTREHYTTRDERFEALIRATFELLRRDFGELIVDRACEELTEDIRSMMERYAEKSAGGGSGNVRANVQWGWVAEIHKRCVANKERVGLDHQECEGMDDASRRSADGSESLSKHAGGKQMELFTQT